MTQAPPLSESFAQWWFAPWTYGGPALPAGCASVLAYRDVYRHWCAETGIRAQLPPEADLRWQDAACSNGARLLQAAELYGGLLAARRQRLAELAALAPARRRWCLSVALTQPLADWSGELPDALRNARGRGLAELALRLERVFPGMWSRLRLLLPRDLDTPLARILAEHDPATEGPVHERDRRCWLLCMARDNQDQPVQPEV